MFPNQARYLALAFAGVVAVMAVSTCAAPRLSGAYANIFSHFGTPEIAPYIAPEVALGVAGAMILVLGWIADAYRKDTEFKERFSAMFENMKDGVIVSDGNGNVTQWNRAANEVLGLSDRQIQGIDPEPSGWRMTTAAGLGLDRSHLPVSGLFALHRQDGHLTWLQVEASPVFAKQTAGNGKNGTRRRLAGVVGTYRDVTAEQNALDRFDLAMKAVKLGLWDWDVVDNTWKWDPALLDIFGIDGVKAKGESILDFVHPADIKTTKLSIELAMLEKRGASLEFRIIRGDGSARVLRTEMKSFYAVDGTALRHVGVSWDITDQRDQEIRVLQASKMFSLGEMSAGIAHEINNPLSIIIGKAESLRESVGRGELDQHQLSRQLEVIDRTAQRIAKIVTSLRAFSRAGGRDPVQPTNVSALVGETVSLCQSRFLNHGIELTVSAIAPELLMEVRSVELSQILLNLLNNAFDAVLELKEKWVMLEVRSDSECVEFAVVDSGNGIPAQIREKMTQPFFTTKDVGQGMGLGLSVSTGIAQAHGGTLSLDPESPYTRMVLRIPLRPAVPGNAAA